MGEARHFDVVICGGGLAGQCLARQLRLRQPELSVCVVEKAEFPLPIAAHKVGESSVEGACRYFDEVVKLKDYMRREHLMKLGLRFFVGDGKLPLEDRVEQGIAAPLPLPSYQIDRGKMENDLRDMNLAMGVHYESGCAVKDIVLADGDEPHRVVFHNKAAARDGAVTARWVVDALGRRRFLQQKLGLERPSPHKGSATWWRIKGEYDVANMVPAQNRAWQKRTGESRRWFSTNHFIGPGYWAWVIPLSTNHTSIGIVTDEKYHPVAERKNIELSTRWLEKWEPGIAKLLEGSEVVDFLALKQYPHLTKQAFSHRRWSCVGEASVFLDPLYSTGSDFISWANLLTEKLIVMDRAGTLTPEIAERYNEWFITMAAELTEFFRDTFRMFKSPRVSLRKLLWDTMSYWLVLASPIFQGCVGDLELMPRWYERVRRYSGLNRRMQELFRQWADRDDCAPWRGFHPFTPMRFLIHVYLGMAREKTPEQYLEYLDRGFDRLEEVAQVFFFEALQKVAPAELAKFPEPRWVNAWAISLDPSRWDADGLRAPDTAPRDLGEVAMQLRDTLSPNLAGRNIRVRASTNAP